MTIFIYTILSFRSLEEAVVVRAMERGWELRAMWPDSMFTLLLCLPEWIIKTFTLECVVFFASILVFTLYTIFDPLI